MGQSDHASFAHVDNNTTENYALKQSAAGTTHLNAKSGQNISFKINNAEKARLTGGGDFYVNTDTLYVDASEDRVGINKAAPAYALDVVGDINFSGTFREDGNPFISTPWTIETSPDALSYTAGNVGIGAADPVANLHVNGNVYVSSTTNSTTTTTGAVIVAGGIGVSGQIFGQHANFEDVEADSVTVTDTTTSTSATTGALKVAGGISTQENLNVGGTVKVDGDTLVVESGTDRVGINKAAPAYALDVVGDINFTGTFREGGNPFVSTPWNIETSPAALNYTAGNVGIGAADPEANLHVTGDVLITGGLITNTGGVGRKTYSFSTNLASGASIENATYVLDFTNHPFHAKVTAMLIESDDEISTLIFDVIGGKLGGSGNSAYVPTLGQQSIISTSTMNTPWSSTIATALAGTTVTIKPAAACTGVVRFNIFVDYLSHETAGRLSTINTAGTSPDSGDFGY